MMKADDVLTAMRCLLDAGVKVWLDGGWAVDAALGEETREHGDVDLLVELDALDAIVDLLGDVGYEMTEDDRPIRIVLSADGDRSIDLHMVTWDRERGGLQPQPKGPPFRYPPEGFQGRGKISGVELPCLTPEVQVLCHSGYEPADTDKQDMRLLAERFGVKLPEAYR